MLDLARVRHEISKHDGSLRSGAQRLALKVDVDRTRERKGDNESRRAEIVLNDVRRDTALEVPITGKHTHQLALARDAMHGVEEGPRIADAAHAAPAARRKPKLSQRFKKACARQELGRRMRTRSEHLFHPGNRPAAKLYRAACNKAASEHHIGIGRRCAAGDRSDADGAMAQSMHLPAE